MKKTKIIATLWPATWREDKIIEMYNSWVNIIRFNFSHANHTDTKKYVDMIKILNDSWKTNLSLLLDTKWPEIRTWDIDTPLVLKSWEEFKIYTSKEKQTPGSIFCDYPFLWQDIEVWWEIIIDSWLLVVKVVDIMEDYVVAKAMSEWVIWSRRHINLPWVKLNLPWVTDKDREDIMFAIENDFDFIAMSFVRNKENIDELKTLLEEHSSSSIKIISKVENQEAIDNIEEIVHNSDWIMVARGDLWIEVPVTKLPFYQKKIVDMCMDSWKIFIIATHLLETMISSPFPTRAEVSDIYNSVLQKADCVMLSWETAMWKYPIQSVKMMRDTILSAQENLSYDYKCFSNDWLTSSDIEKKLLIKHWIYIWEKLWVKGIVLLTKRWVLARLSAGFKPSLPIYAFTNNKKTINFLNILFWVVPFLHKEWWDNSQSNLENAIIQLKESWVLKSWDKVIWITDIKKDNTRFPTLEIISV